MSMNNLYINYEQFFEICNKQRLADAHQIETLKRDALEVDHVFLDYFVPVRLVDDAIKYCREKIEWYRSHGSISRMECYSDFINILKSLSMEADEA